MQRVDVSGAVRPTYGSLGVKRLNIPTAEYSLRSLQFLTNQFTVHQMFRCPGYASYLAAEDASM